MKNKRLRSAHDKADTGKLDMVDFISKMPDDVLVMILTRLPLKRAVATSTLSTRWRFVWRNLTKLKFNGSKALRKMGKDEKLCDLERRKYVNMVNGVINSYSNPRVQVFRIWSDLENSYSNDIDEWIQFAFKKKVEKLELRLMENERDPAANYAFLLPSSNAGVVKMLFLKDLVLQGVNLNEQMLTGILKNSPHLKELRIYESHLFTHVNIGGQDVNLKRLTMVGCSGFESISLYGFDLVSFTHSGSEIVFRFTDMPKLRELDIDEVSVGFNNNVFSQISSCALYLRVLILSLWSAKKGLDVNAIPKLPKVKKLMLVMGAEDDDCLLEYTSIAQACPSLETFSISLHWCSPRIRRKKVRHVAAPHPHEHLKLLEIIGYYGRISDLELAVYAIDNASALKNIVLDPCCHASEGKFSEKNFSKQREEAARSIAKRQLTPILPPGVSLDIL